MVFSSVDESKNVADQSKLGTSKQENEQSVL